MKKLSSKKNQQMTFSTDHRAELITETLVGHVIWCVHHVTPSEPLIVFRLTQKFSPLFGDSSKGKQDQVRQLEVKVQFTCDSAPSVCVEVCCSQVPLDRDQEARLIGGRRASL